MFSFFNWILEKIYQNEEENPWKSFSLALYLLMPLTGCIILWTRKDVLFQFWLQLDKNFISVFCPSLSKRENLLKWASMRLPQNWSSHLRTLSGGIGEFWSDGSLLCTLINTEIPGACPNPHRHWKKPPIHGQSVAYKYLGVLPVFSDEDLLEKMSIIQERRFINYLYGIYLSMSSIQRTKDMVSSKISNQYLARGMGLYAGQRYKTNSFYIYHQKIPNQINKISIYIRGPYRTYGTRTITYPLESQMHLSTVKNMTVKNGEKKSFLGTISIDFGSFLGKSTVSPTNNIPIKIEYEHSRIKVSYIPNNFGMYELTITADGEQVSGSPYNIHITDNADNQIKYIRQEGKMDKTSKYDKTIQKSNTISDFVDTLTQVKNANLYPLPDKKKDKEVRVGKSVIINKNSSCKSISRSESISISEYTPNDKGNSAIEQEPFIRNNGDINSVINSNVINTHEYILQSDENNKHTEIPTTVEVSSSVKNTIKSNETRFNPAKTIYCNEDISKNMFSTVLQTSPSPICLDHIVPEVYTDSQRLAKKRNLFQKQNVVEELDENSTFSNDKNEHLDYSSKKKYNNRLLFRSTKSLPNLAVPIKDNKELFIKHRKFWENLTNSTTTTKEVSYKRNPNNNNLKNITKIMPQYKSCHNILDSQIIPNQYLKPYKSIDTSLDYCTIFSVRQRKEFLLGDKYESEKKEYKNTNVINQNRDHINNIKYNNTRNEQHKYVCKSHPVNEEKILSSKIQNNKLTRIKNNLGESLETESLKSHFVKSIQYFKNLEKCIDTDRPQRLSNKQIKEC